MANRGFIKAACLMAAVLFSAVGCASGPTYSTIQHTIPDVASDKGRVYFYRDGSPFGGAIQPSVMLDGVKVGDSVPGGVFYKDIAPGRHVVVLSTEVDRLVWFELPPRQVRYVKMTVGLGYIVYRIFPELVDERVGAEEIKGLAYTGGQTVGATAGN